MINPLLTNASTYVHTCVYVRTYVHLYMYVHGCTYMHICAYACTFTYIRTWLYIRTYVFTMINESNYCYICTYTVETYHSESQGTLNPRGH